MQRYIIKVPPLSTIIMALGLQNILQSAELQGKVAEKTTWRLFYSCVSSEHERHARWHRHIPSDINSILADKEVMPDDTVNVLGDTVSIPGDTVSMLRVTVSTMSHAVSMLSQTVSIPGETVPGDLDMASAIGLSPSVPKLPLCCPSGWRGVLLAEGMSCGSLALDPSVRLGSSRRSGTCTQRVQWVHDCMQDMCLRHRGNKSTLWHVQCDTPQEKFQLPLISTMTLATCGSQWVGWGCLLGARQWGSSLAGPCWWG